MKNLKMSAKLFVCFTFVIVLSVLSTVVGLVGMGKIKNTADDMYTYNVVALDAIGLIRENYAIQHFITRELIIYDYQSIEYKSTKDSLKELDEKMTLYIAQYEQGTFTEKDTMMLERFQNLYYNNYIPYRAAFIKLTDLNEDAAVMVLIKNNGDSIIDAMTATLQEAYDFKIMGAKEALEYNNKLYHSTKTIVITVLIIAVISVVLMVLYLRRLISKPLKTLSNALGYMGSTGDLELKVNDNMVFYSITDLSRKDEIGMASRAVIDLLSHVWNIEQVLTRISDGDFEVEIETLSKDDTLGMSVVKVAENLNTMFSNMKAAEEAARTASKAKGAFLAHISHEIRTPLNAIIGMAAIAKKADGDYIKAQNSVEQIIASSRHLLNLLNNVLDMSKIESGKLELANEPFGFKSAFDEVCGIIAQSCSVKDIAFTTNISQLNDMTLLGDKMRINQVLINLLGNAVKFTEHYGNVKLNVIVLSESDKDICIRYTISDSGIGMSQEQLSKLFKPFEQTDSRIASKYGGTGLGLSISWNIVEMMGGIIEVESELDKGSVFSFDLCLQKGSCTSEAVRQMQDRQPLQGKRILLAEDIELNRIILCELLNDTGVAIDHAENGKQAVDLFEESSYGFYDLIIMDVQMPIMDGFTATQTIRAMEREDAQTIPIVAMTANAYKEDVERCLSVGMNGHLSKPIEYDTIITKLVEFINANQGS